MKNLFQLSLLLSVVIIISVACSNAGDNNATADYDTIAIHEGYQEDTGNTDTDAFSMLADTLKPSGNPVIDNIREEYQRIQKNPALQKLEVDYSGAPGSEAEAIGIGGTMTYFFNGDELVKVWDAGAESHGHWNEEFYYKNGELFFIYLSGASGGALDPDAFPYQTRLYIENGNIYREITTRDYVTDDIERNALLIKGKALYTIRTEEEIRKFY